MLPAKLGNPEIATPKEVLDFLKIMVLLLKMLSKFILIYLELFPVITTTGNAIYIELHTKHMYLNGRNQVCIESYGKQYIFKQN